MKRVLYIIFGILFLLLVLLVINSSYELYNISEESSPIREGESIVGMDYIITIGEDVKRHDINIATSIISSILHYKDINTINDFYVDLKINNKSHKKYLLKNIMLVNNSGMVDKKVKYKKNKDYIYIKLSKDDFLNYGNNSFIKIELENNTF